MFNEFSAEDHIHTVNVFLCVHMCSKGSQNSSLISSFGQMIFCSQMFDFHSTFSAGMKSRNLKHLQIKMLPNRPSIQMEQLQKSEDDDASCESCTSVRAHVLLNTHVYWI